MLQLQAAVNSYYKDRYKEDARAVWIRQTEDGDRWYGSVNAAMKLMIALWKVGMYKVVQIWPGLSCM